MLAENYVINTSEIWYMGESYIHIRPDLYSKSGYNTDNKDLKIEYRTGHSVLDCHKAQWQKYSNTGGNYCRGFIQICISYEGEAIPPKKEPLSLQKGRKLMLF